MRPGTKYLLASGAGAANTLNAYRPFVRSGVGVVPVMAAGLVTSEMPLQAIAWQMAATTVFAGKGALSTLGGRLGLALSAASWLGLANLHRVARHSADVLERALMDELGSSYRDHLVHVPLPPKDVVLTRRQVVFPSPGRRRPYVAGSDVSYGEFGKRNHLDVWARADLPSDGGAPVLLQIHGGAWVAGNKRGQAHPLLGHLTEQGWVCVAINYRLSPKADWPAHVIDIKRAITWVKQNIVRYGGDPGFIAITGGSAGGHLSSLAALTGNIPEFQPGFEEADTKIQAAVPLYGVYDFVDEEALGVPDTHDFIAKYILKSTLVDEAERWKQASPAYWVHRDAPPFMVVHGKNDVFARAAQARWFADLLRKDSGAPVVYAELPLAQHGFDFLHSVRTVQTVQAIERFLAFVRAKGNDR